jgi:hypothetical protein
MARPKSGPKSGRGGYQAPADPAPVSNPGSGRRTDGGPGSAKQPIRVAPGQGYGQRQALEGQQQAAPLPVDQGPTAGGGAVAPPPPAQRMTPPIPEGGVFGPTDRNVGSIVPPDPEGVGGLNVDSEAYLREMYRVFPSPWIARLMRGSG